MGEVEAYSERMTFDLHEHFVIDGGDMSQFVAGAHRPIHYGGLAAALSNVDPNVNAQVSVQDSANGVTWTPVVLSSMEGGQSSSLLSVTIVPGGQQQIFFTSARRYVRFSVAPNNPTGVHIVTHQWSPRVQAAAAYGV